MLHAAPRTGMGPSMGAKFALEKHRPSAFFTAIEKTVETVTGYYYKGFFAVELSIPLRRAILRLETRIENQLSTAYSQFV